MASQERLWSQLEREKAPEGSTAEIALAADGIGRFTPTVTGQYVFSLEGQNVERSLQVIEASSAPFHNLNYYGSGTMVRVGERLGRRRQRRRHLTSRGKHRTTASGDPGWFVAVALATPKT